MINYKKIKFDDKIKFVCDLFVKKFVIVIYPVNRERHGQLINRRLGTFPLSPRQITNPNPNPNQP